jgi:hypothetical protein
MFGVLNRFIAKLDAAPEEQNNSTHGFGFQVLRNTNQEVPLDPWFDFIIGINGRTIVSSAREYLNGWRLMRWCRTTQTRTFLRLKSATVLVRRSV